LYNVPLSEADMMEELIACITSDLCVKLPHQRKTHRDKLAILVGTLLRVQESNLMVLASALPRKIASVDKRYQYIERYLTNEAIAVAPIMKAYAGEIFARVAASGEVIHLMLDQSQIRGDMQVLMLSVRVGKRALPVLWRVRQTEGNIGWETQETLLHEVASWIPQDASVCLSADRFYGTAALVGWCQQQHWGYRIRLKGNLIFRHNGGTITPTTAHATGNTYLCNATFHRTEITTNIGILHEHGHPEPWFIAMDAQPNRQTILEYGKRWGIEAMFSDFKSRGFGIANTQIKKPKRLEKLLLLLTLALYWATSTGMWCHQQNPQKGTIKKNSVPLPHSSLKDSVSSSL
jgi:hypothetical protein